MQIPRKYASREFSATTSATGAVESAKKIMGTQNVVPFKNLVEENEALFRKLIPTSRRHELLLEDEEKKLKEEIKNVPRKASPFDPEKVMREIEEKYKNEEKIISHKMLQVVKLDEDNTSREFEKYRDRINNVENILNNEKQQEISPIKYKEDYSTKYSPSMQKIDLFDNPVLKKSPVREIARKNSPTKSPNYEERISKMQSPNPYADPLISNSPYRAAITQNQSKYEEPQETFSPYNENKRNVISPTAALLEANNINLDLKRDNEIQNFEYKKKSIPPNWNDLDKSIHEMKQMIDEKIRIGMSRKLLYQHNAPIKATFELAKPKNKLAARSRSGSKYTSNKIVTKHIEKKPEISKVAGKTSYITKMLLNKNEIRPKTVKLNEQNLNAGLMNRRFSSRRSSSSSKKRCDNCIGLLAKGFSTASCPCHKKR